MDERLAATIIALKQAKAAGLTFAEASLRLSNEGYTSEEIARATDQFVYTDISPDATPGNNQANYQNQQVAELLTNQSITQPSRKLRAVILAAVGIGILIFAYSVFNETAAPRGDDITNGKVLLGNSFCGDTIIIGFTASNGTPYQFKQTLNSCGKHLTTTTPYASPGQTVRVAYDPTNPGDAKDITSFDSNHPLAIGAGFLGILALVAGAWTGYKMFHE